MKTAAAIIAGDEILTGKVHDQNSFVLAKVLFERGVRLKTIIVVGDCVDEIAHCVADCSQRYDLVFTSGGIGPTHDDKTYEAVAEAFHFPLQLDEPTAKKLHDFYQLKSGELSWALARMARFPFPYQTIPISGLLLPLVVVKNVHLYPGVPELFARMLEQTKNRFLGTPIFRASVYTMRHESDIASSLHQVQQLHPLVSIGSYPRLIPSTYRVLVTIEGEDQMMVEKVAQELLSLIDGFRPPQ